MKTITAYSLRWLGIVAGVCSFTLSALAQPTITSSTPTSGPVGTTVTITGTNFNTTPANNIVFFGATRASVTTATGVELVVTVPSGATCAPITVLNTTTRLMAYSNRAFTPTYTPPRNDIRAGDFDPSLTVAGRELQSRFVAIGDLDGDGKADLVLARSAVNYVSVLRNNSTSGGAISFDAKIDFETGGAPASLAIGDLDGDGKAELVVAHRNGISVLGNTSTSGAVSFAAKVDFVAGTNTSFVAIGDLDGDGRADLALAKAPPLVANDPEISVLRNIYTTGAFTSASFATKVDFAVGGSPTSIAIGDLDGDGKADLAVAKNFVLANTSAGAAAVLRNTSVSGEITGSSFAAYRDFITGTWTSSIAMGDLDGDGKPDLAVAEQTANSVSVLRNTSSSGSTTPNISFAAKVDFPVGASPTSIAIADVTGDGKADLAVLNNGSASVSIFRNTSTPNTITSFAAKMDFAVSSYPQSLALGDLNGDGKADVATADSNNGVRVLRKIAPIPPAITSVLPTSGVVGTVVTINGNNFAAIRSDNSVFFGTIRAKITASTSEQLIVVVPPGCSYAPITVSNSFSGLSGTSAHFSPTFRPTKEDLSRTDFDEKVDFPVGISPISHAIGDLDSDGKADLAVVNNNILSVLRNTSNNGEVDIRSFASKVDFASGVSPQSIAIGDLDGDEKPDVVVLTAAAANSGLFVFRNTILSSGPFTSSSFAAKVDFNVGTISQYASVAICDLDGDGMPDLAIAPMNGNKVSVLRNISARGEIRFAPKVDFDVRDSPSSIAVGDLDGDGMADLAVATIQPNSWDGSSSNVAVLRNTSGIGTVSFSSPVRLSVGNRPRSIAIGDLDDDGNADLATANLGVTPAISVLLNTRTTTGAISFAPQTGFSVSFGSGTKSITIADVTGDGKADLSAVENSNARLAVLRNITTSGGAISFAPNVGFALGVNPNSLAIGDLDGDGRVDLAVVNQSDNTISVLKNNPMIALAATAATTNSFTANWAPVSGVSSYQLDVSTAANFASFVAGYNSLSVSGTSQVVTGLAANTTYYYRVRSYAGVASQNSNVIAATTLPAAPTGVAVSAAATNAFTASWDYVASMREYTLEVSETADFAVIAFSNPKTASGTRPGTGIETHLLAPGTFVFQAGRTYFLRIRAANTTATSANSLTVSFTTRPATPDAAPTVLSAGQTTITLSWPASSVATSYNLTVDDNADFSSPVTRQANGDAGAVIVTATNYLVSGLAPGTKYYYRYSATNAAGTSGVFPTTTTANNFTTTVPASPLASDPLFSVATVNGAATDVTQAQWTLSTGATAYSIEVSTSSSFSPVTTTTATSSPSTITVNANTQYFYRITASNANGNSLPSNVVSFYTKPGAPTNLQVTAANTGGFTVSWNKVDAATSGYVVNVSTASTTDRTGKFTVSPLSFQVAQGITSYSVSGLSASTHYFYQVQAINSAGSAYATSTSSISTLAVPSGAPNALSATVANNNTVTARWNSVADVTGYLLEVADNSDFNPSSPPLTDFTNKDALAATSIAITGLNNGKTYYYRVRTYKGSNTTSRSAYSNVVSFNTRPNQPAAPTQQSASQNTITLTWNADPLATMYYLDVSTSSTFAAGAFRLDNQRTTATTYMVSGLSSGTTYYYRIRSANLAGTSVDSETGNSPTVPTSAIAIAPDIRTTPSYTAKWFPVAGATTYYVDVDITANFSSATLTVNQAAVTGQASNSYPITATLAPNTLYYYRVTSGNASGNSLPSNVVSFYTKPGAPEPPTSSNLSTSQFTVNWNPVAAATSYDVNVRTGSHTGTVVTGSPFRVDGQGSNSFTITNLISSTKYFFQVLSRNDAGTSDYANGPTAGVTTLAVPSGAPVASPADVSSTAITAKWIASNDLAVSGYLLDVDDNLDFSSPLTGFTNLDVANRTTTSRSITLTSLSDGTTYYYRVRTYKGDAPNRVESLNSNVVSFDTKPTAPATPTRLSASQNTITLSWAAVPKATSYFLDVSTTVFPASGRFTPDVANNVEITTTTYLISGLSSGTQYYYRLRANNTAGLSANSVGGNSFTLPPSPVADAPTVTPTNRITAKWFRTDGTDSYLLEVSTTANFSAAGRVTLTAPEGGTVTQPTTGDVSVLVTSTAIVASSSNTLYYYRVTAINTSGNSLPSNVVSFYIKPGAPEAPTSSNFSTSQFTVNWNPIAAATGYEVNVRTGSHTGTLVSGSPFKVNGQGANSFVVTSLTASTDYFFQVRAVNAAGESTYTNGATSAKTLEVASGAPVARPATVSSTAITANWVASTDAAVTGYLLDVDDNLDFSSPVNLAVANRTTASRAITLADLTDGTTYYYRVRTYKGDAPNRVESLNSNVVSFDTKPTAPATPTRLSASQNTITLSWTAVPKATSYFLDVSTTVFPASGTFTPDVANNVEITTTTYLISGLSSGTQYYYRLRANNTAGLSVNSVGGNSFTLPPSPVADAPTVTPTNSITAKWFRTDGTDRYLLEVSTTANFSAAGRVTLTAPAGGTVTQPTTGDVTAALTATLTDNMLHYYRVTAINGSGNSLPSNVVSFYTKPGAPAPPTSSNLSTSQFTVNWIPVAAATSYDVNVRTGSHTGTVVTGSPFRVDGQGSNSFTITNLISSTKYFFQVLSRNDAGTSDYANGPTAGVTTLAVPSGAPTASPATVSTTAISANWVASTDAAVTGYLLDVDDDLDFSSPLTGFTNLAVANRTTTSRAITLTSLSDGTTYYYRVRTYKGDAPNRVESPNSNVVSFDTKPTKPAAPTRLSASQNTMTLSWVADRVATRYFLDVSTTAFPATGAFTADVLNNVQVTASSFLISRLSAGTKYFYRVRAANTAGTSASSDAGTSFTIPPTPVADNPAVAATNRITAKWFRTDGADSYLLEVSKTANFSAVGKVTLTAPSGGTVTQPTTGDVTAALTATLTDNTLYYYRITAINESGNSLPSNAVTFYTKPSALAAPTFNGVTSSQFTVNWIPLDAATSYIVKVRNSSNAAIDGSPFTVNGQSASSYTVSGLTASTTYKVQVAAANNAGTSADTRELSVTTTATASGAPNALAATLAEGNSITANWTIVTGASYQIDVSDNSAFSGFVADGENKAIPAESASISLTDATTATPAGLGLIFEDGKTYYYRVRSLSSGAASAPSNVVAFNPRPLPPATTSSLSPGQGSFTASWSVSNGATSYLLDVSKNKDMSEPIVSQLELTAASFSVQGLDPGTTYYFEVKAKNDAGTSLTAATSAGVITIPTTPFATDPVVAEGNTVIAKWIAVDGVSTYLLTVADNPTFTNPSRLEIPSSETARLLPDLADGKQYFYRVVARNSSGASLPSNIVSFFTKPGDTGAGGVSGLVAPLEQITQTTFALSWNAVAGATGYFVDVCTDNTFTSCRVSNRLLAGSSNTSFNATNLLPNTTYFVRVRATNAAGTSPSASISVTTDSNIPAPTATAATGISTTGFTANWLATTSAARYKLFLYTDANLNNPVANYPRTVSGLSLGVTGLAEGQSFYYQVVAVNDKNLESAPSNTISIALPRTTTAEMLFGNGGNIGDFRIRSYPVFIGTPTLETGLSSANFGTFWRVLHYDTDTKKTEDVSDVMTLAPATGYWTNARALASVKVTGNYKDQDHTLTLKPGWNQIGNPFLNRSIDWENVLSANSGVTGIDKIGKLYTYNEPTVSATQPFQQSDKLRPYGGGFVSNKHDNAVTLTIRANTSGGRVGREAEVSASPVGDKWMLPIALSVGDYESRLGGIGMNPDASTGIDKYDELALPRFFQYVEFASGGLMRSVVPTAAKHEWLFQAAANGDDTKGTISWNSTALNASGAARLYLHDQTTNTLLDMSQHSSYAFDLKKGNQVKFIYLQDGMPTESIVAEPYPNPFASSVAVPIMMVEETEVALTVYDLTGGVVHKSLTALPAGFSELTWTNADAPQGLYLMKIEIGKDRVLRKVMKR